MKDFENMVLEQGMLEVSGTGQHDDKAPSNRLGLRMKVVENKDGEIDLKRDRSEDKSAVLQKWTGYLSWDEIKVFLQENGLTSSILHTEFNHPEFKCYGHPCTGHQEWVEAMIDDVKVQVQTLIFCKISEEPATKIKTQLYVVDSPGTYAIVHFLPYDVFGVFKRSYTLYGSTQKSFHQHEDSFLIRGWSKHTSRIHQELEEDEYPSATIAMIPVECIQHPLIAMEDVGSFYPHSWLLIRARNCWAGGFRERMKQDKECRKVMK